MHNPALTRLLGCSADGVVQDFYTLVFLSDVPAESLSLVIDFLYTGSIQLNPLVVFQLLLAANKLEIQSLVDVCQEYLEDQQPFEVAGVSLTEALKAWQKARKRKGQTVHQVP